MFVSFYVCLQRYKHYFTNRVVNTRIALLNHVVVVDYVNGVYSG